MQAMSLVVTDGDGEQNEMRMLQDKLALTMKVVTTLTGQLNELKEQVPGCWFYSTCRAAEAERNQDRL